MERKNQICKAGQQYLNSMDEFQRYHTYPRETFIDGAKWADEHPKPGMVNKAEFIEKVKNWLKNNIDEDVFVKYGNVVKIMDADDFSEYFCKVMEE